MWWIWAVEANLPWPSQPIEVSYNGRTFDILPQTDENFASIAVQAGIDESDAVSKAVHRFLSVLAWVDGRGIRTLWSVGNPGWRQPTPRSPYLAKPGLPQARSNFDFLPIPGTEQASKALAFHREAVSTRSRDNRFLQYFRIIELAYGHRKAEHPRFINQLITSASVQGDALSAVQALESRGLNVGRQVVVFGRHAVAHGDDEIAIDPDIVSERALLDKLTPIVAALAIYTIELHFGVPTRQTYYRRHEYEVEGFVAALPNELREAVLGSDGTPVSIAVPVKRISMGLRDRRYPAFTDLTVSQAIMHDGGVTLRMSSPDGLLQALVHFDMASRKFVFDLERELHITDDGSSASAEHARDMFELVHGLVGNGELHAWDATTGALLGRQNPNLPVNIDSAATHALLTAQIERCKQEAQTRREIEHGSAGQSPGDDGGGGDGFAHGVGSSGELLEPNSR